MKKFLQSIAIGLAFLSITACKHSIKENEVVTSNSPVAADHVIKEVYTDSYGDQMEVTINNTRNTVTLRLSGKTYELKKSEDLPEYTASDAEYQYSDIRGNITFLKKNADMVLFHYKQNGKGQSSTKMVSH